VGEDVQLPAGEEDEKDAAELAQERVLRLRRAEPYPGIHGAHIVVPGDDRIQVKLGQLGKIISQPGNPQEDVRQRPGVHGLPAPVPEQQRRGAYVVDEPGRIRVSQRGQPGSVITEDLGGDPPRPKTTSGPNTGSCTTPTSTSTPVSEHRLNKHSA
jgi:hypothetical protein